METKSLKASQKTKKTPMGEIPVDWSLVELGSYIKEVSYRNSNNQNNVSVLSVTNTQGLVISEEYFDRKIYSKDLSNYKMISKGQFAYNPSRINVGSIARLGKYNKGLLSPMYVVFKAIDGLNPDFLEYWISSQRFNNLVKANTQGTVRHSLNYSALEVFPFVCPPINEQQKIAEILSVVDNAINKTQAVIDQTRILKKGLMQELFTRGIPGRHKKFKKTEVGNIPAEWEVMKIRDVGEIVTGTTPSTKKSDYYNEDYLWATPTDLGKNKYITSTIKMLSKKGAGVARLIPRNSVLIVCIGSTIGKVGMAFQKMATNQQINSIICQSNWDPNFVYYWMVKNSDLLKLFAGKQAVPIINKNILSLITILKLPKEEQKKIGEVLDSLDLKIQKERECINSFNTIKSALMQVLLTGEVRVKY